VFAATAIALAGCAAAGAASARAAPAPDTNVIPGSYIVVYEREDVERVGAETTVRERRLGFQRQDLFRHAVEGFSASLTRRQATALRRDPEVDFVSVNRRVRIAAAVPLAPGEPVPPTGVRRILAGTATTVRQASGVGVAVIDTGIQLDHPDLNAEAGTDCIDPGTSPADGHGHGTHVAGTIGAENDGAGVTGVAPGTEVFAVRVLGNDGAGSFASIICGIDWVTANQDTENIGVANMSLGGVGPAVGSQTCATTVDATRLAICRSTRAGVNYAVAAGNLDRRFDSPIASDVPAAYPEVLTVTALSDSDAIPGALGGAPACRPEQFDDRDASFSNHAQTATSIGHTIAAPGVCINSTWLASGYNTISGTSMAAPHAAGLVALCVNEGGTDGPCADDTPAQVIKDVRADAEAFNTADPGYGFLHDPLHEPIFQTHFGFLAHSPIAPVARTLEVTLAGAGTGTVTGPQINCPGDCTGTYADDTPLTLTATAAPGSDASGFSGDCTGQTCALTMGTDRSATASFALTPPPPPPPPDTDPPQTEIDAQPRNRTAAARVTYRFSADEPGSTFECKLDRKRFRPCDSPRRLRVDDGKHKFRVRATDAAGNTDPSAAKDRFRVTD
jgi:hypothetical protein